VLSLFPTTLVFLSRSLCYTDILQAEFTESLTNEVWSVVDGLMSPSGHNWVQGQGSGPRLANKDDDEEEKFDVSFCASSMVLLLTCVTGYGQQARVY
jgi:hypothetical protein